MPVKDENRSEPKPKHSALTSSVEPEEEQKLDLSLRPHTLRDFVGQERLKKILGISIQDWERPHWRISLPVNWV